MNVHSPIASRSRSYSRRLPHSPLGRQHSTSEPTTHSRPCGRPGVTASKVTRRPAPSARAHHARPMSVRKLPAGPLYRAAPRDPSAGHRCDLPRAIRTVTLQGSSSPTDGTAEIAWNASGGLHSPRIMYGRNSRLSFSRNAARRSISVRMPNPSCLSASRTRVSAGWKEQRQFDVESQCLRHSRNSIFFPNVRPAACAVNRRLRPIREPGGAPRRWRPDSVARSFESPETAGQVHVQRQTARADRRTSPHD